MVFLWFSYGFPMVFLWFSSGSPDFSPFRLNDARLWELAAGPRRARGPWPGRCPWPISWLVGGVYGGYLEVLIDELIFFIVFDEVLRI